MTHGLPGGISHEIPLNPIKPPFSYGFPMVFLMDDVVTCILRHDKKKNPVQTTSHPGPNQAIVFHTKNPLVNIQKTMENHHF